MRDGPQLMGRMRSNQTYQEPYDEVDPVKLTLEDYNVFSRIQQHRRYLYRNLPVHDEEDDSYIFDEMTPNRPRVNFNHLKFINCCFSFTIQC